jgi:hypothetical protein
MMNRSRPLWARAVVLLLCLLWRRDALAFYMPPVLDPHTYRSPSGRFELTVDPSDLYGCGPAKYRFNADGKELWSKTLPYTLCRAAVTDRGLIVGYGYTRSPGGFWNRGDAKPMGEFLVVLLDADGKLRLKESEEVQNGFVDGRPMPIDEGLIVDAPNDRTIVRLCDIEGGRLREKWWICRLSNATPVRKVTPQALSHNGEPQRSLRSVVPVRGTPFLLVHWSRSEGPLLAMKDGATFTLVDETAKPIWELDLPTDYMFPGDKPAADRFWHSNWDRVTFVRSNSPGRFDLPLVADSKRATFSVTRTGAEGWTVTEMSRTSSTLLPPDQPKASPANDHPLKALKPLALNSDGPSAPHADAGSPFHDIGGLSLDDRGRIAFLRNVDANRADFVLVNTSGHLITNLALTTDSTQAYQLQGPCWLRGSRFMVANVDNGTHPQSRAWWIDADTGKVVPMPDVKFWRFQSWSRFSDGGFVILDSDVIAFDNQGRRTWTLKDDYTSRKPDAIFNVLDVATTTRDEVVVLEYSQHRVKCFDRQGHYLRTIDIAKVWGREPNYLAHVTADVDGGFLVEDFGGRTPFVRMTSDGRVRGSLTPKFADGRSIDTRGEIVLAPDGRLWANDGHCIVRLNAAGVADLVLGQPPQSDVLQSIAGILVDNQGHIDAVDTRSGSIHIFDAAGHFLRVCRTKPTDVKEAIWDPALTVTEHGDVYLGLDGNYRSPGDSRTFAHFAADGTRVGDVVWPNEKCQIQPGTGRLVAQAMHDVDLIEPTGRIAKKIQRRPDGKWLAEPHCVAVAADGSIAILAGRHDDEPATVSLYAATGEPLCTIALSEVSDWYPRLAYDGRRVVVAADDGLSIYDRSGHLRQHSPRPPMVEKDSGYSPHILAGGRELAIFDGKHPVLHRFELP